MLKKLLFAGCLIGMSYQLSLHAHCQMPCGIYHDEMVFDQIDQYVETTVKGLSVLADNAFKSTQERNEFIRWIIQKENSSNEIAHLITSYFLQQKIKPDEEDTAKRVLSAHKLLFLIVQIKQTVDLKVVSEFYEEWERFKLMFHIEGYKCKINQVKLKKWEEKRKEANAQGSLNEQEDHDHSHEHSHEHDDHDHHH